MNKRGDFTGVLILIVSIAAFAIFLLTVSYIMKTVNPAMQANMGISNEINQSFTSGVNVVTHTFPFLWLIMFSGLMLGVMASAWFIPSHPIFFPFFAILLIIAIAIAMPLSNAYDQYAAAPALASTAAEQGTIGFMMTNLPYLAFIIGLIVLVLSFAKPGGTGVIPV